MRERAIRRIRSLLEVAKATSGATPAERETARSLALKLMSAHGLRESEIPLRAVERPLPPPPPPVQPFVTIIVFGAGGFGFSNQNPVNNGWAWNGGNGATNTTTGGF